AAIAGLTRPHRRRSSCPCSSTIGIVHLSASVATRRRGRRRTGGAVAMANTCAALHVTTVSGKPSGMCSRRCNQEDNLGDQPQDEKASPETELEAHPAASPVVVRRRPAHGCSPTV